MNLSPFWYRVPLIIAAIGAIAGLTLEFTLLRGYASHWWNHIPAFYLIYGALSAFILSGISILVGGLLKEEKKPLTKDMEDES